MKFGLKGGLIVKKNIRYVMLKVLRFLSLQMLCSPCPKCKEGFLHFEYTDGKWNNVYVCDKCKEEFL